MVPIAHPDSDPLFDFAPEPLGDSATDVLADRWKILIVDDEPDVHSATLLALRDIRMEGRPLCCLHAHSAGEARSVLAAHADIAVLLLDVVMESDSAGLDLVRHVREELGRRELRIVLRTGQPGYAPEVETITQYDINDYKSKSELTRTRLFTTLTVAIRSYKQIRQAEATREGLENIIAASIDLGRSKGIKRFADGVVTQLCALLGMEPDGLVCASAPVPGESPLVLAAAGRFAPFIGQPLEALPDPQVASRLKETLRLRKACLDHGTYLHFPVGHSAGVAAYLDVLDALDVVDQRLIEVFSTNITAGFENVYLQEQVSRLAYVDALTGLPNRNAFIERVRDLRSGDAVVAQIDIDNFSGINSVLDFSFGDQVLLAVARRIEAQFPEPMHSARLATDVFGLLGPRERLNEESISALFAEPFQIGEHSLRLSATCGLVDCRLESTTAHAALQNSAIALKQAKSLARSKCLYFESSQSQAAKERLLLLNDLRTSFLAERLFLVYQPFVELSTGATLGAEALLRWKNDQGDYVAPDRFIPLAEESGLIVPLGQWIMRVAFREHGRFKAAARGPFRIAINVSHIQFREPDFVDSLERAMADCGTDPRDVEIELTESVAIEDLDHIVKTLERIRALGVSISVDDFGTGYSSLSVIRRLPVQRLKIDRAFVGTLQTDPSIASLVIGLARQLGLETIAEGVETPEQLGSLQELLCQEGQGYFFAKPMQAEDMLAYLTRSAMRH